MVGVGEILAITSLVLQVVAAVDKVILIFDRAQNAPDELRHFRNTLSRLQNNVNLLKAKLKILTTLPQSCLDEIEETLILCKDLFVDYQTDQGSSSNPLRAIWSPRETSKLEKYQRRIDGHYLHIILPLWLATIRYAKNYAL
jgi:MoaA/NifB/PqqE/SkfB family radical SAM enzyme